MKRTLPIGAAAALALALYLPYVALAVSPEEIADAMGVLLSDCSPITLSGQESQREVLDQLGTYDPLEGPTMALLYTGDTSTLPSCEDHDLYYWGEDTQGNELYDRVDLTMECLVPAGASSLSFSFAFFSREYPADLGALYSDTFSARLTSAAWDGAIVYDGQGESISVNSELFTITNPLSLPDTGFDCGSYGGGTTWLQTVAPVVAGETVEIRFTLYDLGDGVLDSAVLLDEFAFGDTALAEPATGVPFELYYVSPKTGPLGTEQEVTVHGDNFTDDLQFYLGGTQLVAVLLDSNRATLSLPAWEQAGLEDLRAQNDAFSDDLSGAFTFVDDPPPSAPVPIFTEIEPERGLDIGGDRLDIYGAWFQQDAVASFHGTTVETVFIDAGHLQVVTPARDAGLAEVTVCNPNGLCTTPSYLFVYEETESDPPADEESYSSDSGAACHVGGAPPPQALPGLLGALAGLAVWLRRRT